MLFSLENVLTSVKQISSENFLNHQVLASFCSIVLSSIYLFPLSFYSIQQRETKMYFAHCTWKSQLNTQVHHSQCLLSTQQQNIIQSSFIYFIIKIAFSPLFNMFIISKSSPKWPLMSIFLPTLYLRHPEFFCHALKLF